ncbi:hypothetical protein [Cyclobacterium salsum]|uniref:hypothetical protein n=1 Tax=Cyclobacterium salsum TaxID=2666329 RepID=UPI001391406B|nr:hypothetical protein [Cyclobacterium salsum]
MEKKCSQNLLFVQIGIAIEKKNTKAQEHYQSGLNYWKTILPFRSRKWGASKNPIRRFAHLRKVPSMDQRRKIEISFSASPGFETWL